MRTEADVAAVLSARSLGPARAGASVRLARALCGPLGAGGAEPAVLLLVPAWYGWTPASPQRRRSEPDPRRARSTACDSVSRSA